MNITSDTPRREMHWWQDWKWVASIATLLFVIAFSTFVFTTVKTGNTVDKNSPVISQLNDLAKSNAATLDRLDKNQAGIDELVAFVHEVEAQQSAQGAGQSQIVKDLIEILCSSSDPVRVEACVRLGYQGAGG